MAEWTDEQRRLLVECAYHATEITGHELQDCLMELHRLVKAFRAGNVREDGWAKNDNE